MSIGLVVYRHTGIRLLVFVVFVGGAAIITPVARSAQADESQVQIEWKVPAPQVEDAQKRLALPAQAVPSEDGTRGPPLFYLLAGAAALPSVVDAIISLYRDMIYGGVVIDACNNRLEVHNDRSIPGKVMVVRCAEKLTPLYLGADARSAELIKVVTDAMARK